MITDSEKEAARAELRHALDALEDGAGQEWWGTGSVLERMGERRAWRLGAERRATTRAMQAFSHASALSAQVGAGTVLQAISFMRRVSPAVLEELLSRDVSCTTCGMDPCHALCGRILHDS